MQEIKKIVKSIKKDFIFTSVALIVVGLLFVIFPKHSTNVVCYATGVALCIWGVIRIVSYFSGDKFEAFGQTGLVQGVALLIVGILIVARPSILAEILTTVFGIILLIDGIMKIQYAVDLSRVKADRWWTVLTVALVTAALAVVILIQPFTTALALTVFIGIALIAAGLSDLFTASYVSKTIKTLKKEIGTEDGQD